jgi:hypothetical protein
VEQETRLGYVILAGLLDPNKRIELRRIVILEKGQGYGKATIELTKDLAFKTYQAHRLWFDVGAHNHCAQAVCNAAGFRYGRFSDLPLVALCNRLPDARQRERC